MLVQKVEFDLQVRNATPLEVIDICTREKARIIREAASIGSQKWAYSQYRHGWTCDTALIPGRRWDQTDDSYCSRVASEVLKLGSTVDHDDLKAMVILALMRLSLADAKTYRQQQRGAVVKDLDPTANRRGIINVDLFIEIGSRLLDAPSYLDRVLGLCAMTGRRTIEIATSAQFDKVDTDQVGFVGQAKVRDRDDVGRYVIPTLTDADKVIATLETIRQARPQLWGMASATFHSRCGKDLYERAKAFREVFDNHTATPKDLRSAWAEITWLLFDDRRTGKALYLSRMLGHGPEDLLTAQSYDDFLILDPEYSS